MMDDAASLDRLHDIVVPGPVPFWPPATGWLIVFGILLLAALALLVLGLVRYHRNAYRRAALKLLPDAGSAAEISVLLKRTALATYPREVVAGLTGAAWVEWLARMGELDVPGEVMHALGEGIYSGGDPVDLERVRAFAEQWIRGHRRFREC
jgi:hypothetical protein